MKLGATHRKLSLAAKLHLMLVLPLLVVSLVVCLVTYRGLESNADELAATLRFQAKTGRILSLLLIQDDASKTMLIKPESLAEISAQKIEAYDEHKRLLTEVQAESATAETRAIIHKLFEIDEQTLRPIDTAILEKLFDDPKAASDMYFRDYEPHRQEYQALIAKLAAAGSDTVNAAALAMQRKNIASLAQIVGALLLGIVVMVVAITMLSRQVERSQRNMTSLLDGLPEGMFFFDRFGRIASERSQALQRVLPGSEAITSLQTLSATYAGKKPADIDSCLSLLWSPDDGFLSDFETTVTMLPQSVTLPGDEPRTVVFDYRPQYDARGTLQRVIVSASDVTVKLRNEREALLQAERVRKVAKAAASLVTYRAFVAEANAIVARLDATFAAAFRSEAAGALKRDLHTLKGNVATFDFDGLAGDIHAIEDMLADGSPEDAWATLQAAWQAACQRWVAETADIGQVLGLRQTEGRLLVRQEKLGRLAAHAQQTGDARLADLVADLERHPAEELLRKYETYLQRLTARSGDKQARLVVDGGPQEFTIQDVQRIDAALVHLVRNSLDHGVEPAAERRAKGKSETGTIRIGLARDADGWFRATVEDDGGGIDCDKLSRKAVERGIWTPEKAETASRAEKLELVFAPSLSTKDEVTETSGRGVGMDAVKAAVEQLGGRIEISSQPARGSRFVIVLPPSATGALAVAA